MRLQKVTDKGKTGNFYSAKNEILTISCNNGTNPEFYSFDDTLQVRQVDLDYFALSTIGETYKEIEKNLPAPIFYYQQTKGQNGEIYLCTYQEDIIYGFDKLGKKIYEWQPEIGVGHPIYDIKFQASNCLWLAFPTGQTVAQVSLTDKIEIYRIGDYSWDDISDPLSYPESIFIKDNFLYIPNMGNCKLFKMDLDTKAIEHLATFEEKIWQYEETDIGTFVVTDTGIYKVLSW